MKLKEGNQSQKFVFMTIRVIKIRRVEHERSSKKTSQVDVFMTVRVSTNEKPVNNRKKVKQEDSQITVYHHLNSNNHMKNIN